MDKLQVERSQINTPSSSSATTPTSRPASRRTSTIIPRETLPTPPPDPREPHSRTTSQPENVFVYPPTKKDLPKEFHGILNYAERQEEFQKMLNKSIKTDCKALHQASTSSVAASTQQSQPPIENITRKGSRDEDKHQCQCCDKVRKECEETMLPLNYRLNSTITAALATYGAIEQLNRMYTMWDQYLTMERDIFQPKQCLRYVRLLERKLEDPKPTEINSSFHDNEIDQQDMEQSIAMLETILKPDQTGQHHPKAQDLKQQRERSKSFMIEDMSSMRGERDASKSNAGHLLRRQSTYSDSKSKVSKWTKVKAAFKWEKANVPALNEGSRDSVGLQPNNTELARYLRVPSLPCGNSSADSILSSSSGHFLSETGTPGTISSASSMDDIDNACVVMRRDSSKSDILDTQYERPISQPILQESRSPDSLTADFHGGIPNKSSSNKSIRKSKLVPDFEVVPEDVEAVITAGQKRKNRSPPSPLNLNLKQDLNDPDHQYFSSPHLLKASPQDGTQSLNRQFRKITSPANSSVPSSPSRHSDFFAEFDCEEISSGGDFSEPNSPNHFTSRKSFELQQDEINRRYQILRARLDKEFENKRKEWQTLKPNRASVTAPRPLEPLSPNPSAISSNISAKLLEENLTPDFKKKLQKWRVKKQASIGGIQPSAPMSPTLPNTKIDWHLWKTGQLKLEGQGLTPLPDQKDLPEDFQKKLEQWNKIKRGGSATSCTDSMKRTYKHGGSGKKGESDDDRGGGGGGDKDRRLDKHKPHDKEKSERLAKLKAIVSEHPAKEIQVKTSAGVMKFEGISRKFTRKLYEWEKARGIGPESSTFALLHPGYCPIDVKRISKETHNNENSPTLSRSLSLDSISPSIALPVISQQASSQSLNDVNDLKDLEGGVSSTDALALDSDYKKYEEPEAVMVEVEDHIVETASPLKLIHPLAKKQTPVYKYEEKTCKDFCNSRRIQSYESHTNLAPLLNVLKNSEELLKLLKHKSPDIAENETLRLCDGVLALIRSSYSYYADNLMKPNVLNAISDVQNELSRLRNLCEKSPLDEACCQEIMEERNIEYNEEFQGLHETLEILKQNIQGGYPRFSKDIVPDINIINDEGFNSSTILSADNRYDDTVSTTLEATDELSASMVENDTEVPLNAAFIRTLISSHVNGAGVATGPAGCGGGIGGTKKKIRLRKMGSRQNSKTESDSSDVDNNSILETPRRLKRKNYRLKQRSFDDDPSSATIAEDMVYVLKMKPGQPIQQIQRDNLNKPIENNISNQFSKLPLATSTSLPNVFVKTKRKVFTTIQEPMATDGLAVIEQEILHSPTEPTKEFDKIPSLEIQKEVLKHPTEVRSNLQKDFFETEDPLNDLELEVLPRVLLVHKSISLDDVRCEGDNEMVRLSHSMECLEQAKLSPAAKDFKGFRAPLATDSFRLLSRKREIHPKVGQLPINTNNFLVSPAKKDNIYKKHSETLSKPHVSVKGATIKKIENKIGKTNSGSSVPDSESTKFLSPDKLDNTVPRIARKLERKSLTPTTQLVKFEYPTPTNSEPTSPVYEQSCRPLTPLTERAIRIQKAKEDFLRGKPSPRAVVQLRENFQRGENWAEKRQSDLSLGSTTADDSSLQGELYESEENSLHKSLSADTIRAESPPTLSDAGTDQDFGGIYDSIPRQVTRSGKISSKLGFATLASKLRRVKGKKPKDPQRSLTPAATATSASGSALSALCRQSLFADIIAVPQIISSDSNVTSKPASGESVMKSQSSPHAILRGPTTASGDLSRFHANDERLNKSQSEQYVKRHKESYV